MAAEVIDFFRGEMHVFQKFEGLFEACGDEVIAMGRKMADEKLEGGVASKRVCK